jgi:glycosyltransferase involved in cell wall biosynthesis
LYRICEKGNSAIFRDFVLRYNLSVPSICIIPKATATGGVTSFQKKMSAGLAKRGIQVTYSLQENTDAVLLTGGSRDIPTLIKARRRGISIVQRLDGINWLHRRLHTGVRHYLRSEYGNCLLAFLRARIVTRIVYQSDFVRSWWTAQFGQEHVPSVVIHNGVDLSIFTPAGPGDQPTDHYQLLLVEGRMQGGYETGLETAVEMANQLSATLPVELAVAGLVSQDVKASIQGRCNFPLFWAGVLPGEKIPTLDRSAHLLYSADINAACPNAVIEALACGLPVVAFNTGALPELVVGDAGRLVPYGGDPWKLERPDVPALAAAATEILKNQPRFRRAARRHAEVAFGLDLMVEKYLDVLLGGK